MSDILSNVINKYEKLRKANISNIKPIYEKIDRGLYIVKYNSSKYVLKVKQKKDQTAFEKHIYKILKLNNNENIIEIMDYDNSSDYCYCLYKYFKGDNLMNYLSKNSLSIQLILSIMLNITKTLKYLHLLNVIHCDLKLDNIIINKSNNIKIIDYELSIYCKNENGLIYDYIIGTTGYIAPETYNCKIYSKKTDIWQLGVIFYLLITKEFPIPLDYPLMDDYIYCREDIHRHINFDIFDKSIDKYFKKYNDFDANTKICKTLIRNMLEYNDTHRYSSDEILDNLMNLSIK